MGSKLDGKSKPFLGHGGTTQAIGCPKWSAFFSFDVTKCRGRRVKLRDSVLSAESGRWWGSKRWDHIASINLTKGLPYGAMQQKLHSEMVAIRSDRGISPVIQVPTNPSTPRPPTQQLALRSHSQNLIWNLFGFFHIINIIWNHESTSFESVQAKLFKSSRPSVVFPARCRSRRRKLRDLPTTGHRFQRQWLLSSPSRPRRPTASCGPPEMLLQKDVFLEENRTPCSKTWTLSTKNHEQAKGLYRLAISTARSRGWKSQKPPLGLKRGHLGQA